MTQPFEEARSPLLRHPLRIALAIILMIVTVRIIDIARDTFFLGFFGILLATVFSFPIRLFSKLIPRAAAVLLTLILLGGAITAISWVSFPTLSRQARHLIEQVPDVVERVETTFARLRESGVPAIPEGKNVAQNLKSRASELVEGTITRIVPAAVDVAYAVTGAILLIVFAAFLSHGPESYAEGLKALVPRESERTFDELTHRLAIGLRHWVGGILIGMTIMGSFTAIAMAIAGIDSWPLLGLLTFLGTFVPYLGAIASSIPGLILGLAKSPTHFFYALAIYVSVHILEGYLISPFVMNRAVELRPALLLIWQVLMGSAFGIPGIVVATPLLVCLKVIVGYLYIERRLKKPGPRI